MYTSSMRFVVLAIALGGCSADAAAPVLPLREADQDSAADLTTGRDAGARTDAPVAPPSSKGMGGVTCTAMTDVGGGHSVCTAKEGAVEYRLVVPNAAGPHRLAVYLHGDGAGAYKSNGAIKALLPWAEAHHALVLAALSPNACAWWQAASQTNCSGEAVPDLTGANAESFEAVLVRMRERFDVLDGPIFYYGSSGGSVFLTYSFLPKFGGAHPGIFALNCGGSKPDLTFLWDAMDPALRDASKLSFTYGDQDFLKTDIEKSQAHYGGVLGFAIDKKVIPGAAHCAFDGHGRAVEVWDAYVAEKGL